MIVRKSLLLVLLIVCTIGQAQPQPQQAIKSGMSDADRSRLDDLRAKGFEALYNLDYDAARSSFKEIERLFPDHPAGAQFQAALLWSKALNESRRLKSSLYGSDEFYEGSEDKVDERLVDEFRDYTRRARLLAESRLKRDPKDVEALYFLGATEGLKAAFEAGVQRSFMSALRDGSRSVDRHRDVVKLDAGYHDAELTIGFYDYVVGSLPLPVKLLASMTGARGSKKRGLETLARVASEGRWARDDAKALLIVLYKREKRFTDALRFARELGEKYPRNYLFKLEAADALSSQAAIERAAGKPAEAAAREREAFAIFDALLREKPARGSALSRAQDQIHFQYGETLLAAGQFERAAKEFLAATTVAGAEQGLVTQSHLRAAQSYDLSGRRNEALAQYRIVVTRPDIYDSQAEAKRGLREPYKSKQDTKTASKEE
jgi:tetratricopeptide (TPR) repeat protein